MLQNETRPASLGKTAAARYLGLDAHQLTALEKAGKIKSILSPTHGSKNSRRYLTVDLAALNRAMRHPVNLEPAAPLPAPEPFNVAGVARIERRLDKIAERLEAVAECIGNMAAGAAPAPAAGALTARDNEIRQLAEAMAALERRLNRLEAFMRRFVMPPEDTCQTE
jgi:hypothetical protein